MTDSGGLQKEADRAAVPCVTLRNETNGWRRSSTDGTFLLAPISSNITAAVRAFSPPAARPRLYGGLGVADRCVEVLNQMAARGCGRDRTSANMMDQRPDLQSVRGYRECNPSGREIGSRPPGTLEYFAYYDRLREANEPLPFSSALHEYEAFAGKRVLDIGSGNGYVLSKYAGAGARVQGVDLTRTAIQLCRKRFALTRLRGDFLVGNAERLPFRDEAFDCVCSMGVLHHTPNTERAVSEVFRVLRPGGRVILMFYHRNSLQDPV